MVGRLFAQDPALYAEIVFATPSGWRCSRIMCKPSSKTWAWSRRGDKREFAARFREVAEWFGPFSEQAMRESSFLVEQLVHRF